MYLQLRNLYHLYNSFDTRSKRCIIIDLYSILFVILPSKSFLSRTKCSFWGGILLFLLMKVKGKEEVYQVGDIFINRKIKKFTIY